ncbi:MAG: serine hydrolase [Bacteroidales bacterium]|nr:serine hydrolase [Bacteroidales bacterium]
MSKHIYIFGIISILLFISTQTYSQSASLNNHIDATDTTTNNINYDSLKPYKALNQMQWVDSVFNSLSEDERIAQMIMIRAHSNKTKAYHEKIANVIRNQKVGGLCFFQGGPGRQINLINYYQSISKAPLLIAIDGEWGVSMRLDSAIRFPRQMTLGAIQNDSLIYQMGQAVAKQCKAVGVDMNFAPVVDVNNNPKNPVINSRSFGENPNQVAKKATMYMKGMQSEHLLTCAKHFPGHGDTDSDSHKTLPTVHANRSSLDSIHLAPFKMLFDEGATSVMVAHLYIPALDSTKNLATTLSPLVVDSLLKKKMKFKGLAITDALEMKGVSNYFKPGELEIKALQAGNDILLMPNDAQISIDSIKVAMHDGRLDSTDIYSRIKLILNFKYTAGLANKKNLNKDTAIETLNALETEALVKNLYRSSITLIKNDSNILPLTTNLNKSLAIISIGEPSRNAYTKTILKYRSAKLFSIKSNASDIETKSLANKLKGFDYVIMGVFKTSNSPQRHYGIYPSTYKLAELVSTNTQLIIDMHANPYAANKFIDSANAKAILISYQDNNLAMEAAAEAIFGGYLINGRLPVSIDSNYQQGFGLETKKKRLSFGNPEEIGIKSSQLYKIDSLINNGIEAKAYPGCQVLIAKDGFVFYEKNFGSQTYKNTVAISDSSIYDLASITKVMATTISIMQLSKANKIDVDQTLGYYLSELDSTNKKDILIRDIMAHQAQLTPWIPFYLHALDNGKLNKNLFREKAEEGYTTKVCDNIYILDSYSDSIMLEIDESKLRRKRKYKYSDLGMYYLRRIIEQQSGMDVEQYIKHNIYEPLGLQTIGYLPLERFPMEQIVPTEEDIYFRHKKIQGYVHDQAAAMMGGVEGHAGLFSNSLDLAILSQMLVQHGTYGDDSIVDKNILDDFTNQQFPLNSNRRGCGFDKPLPNHEQGGPTCNLVSSQSFGHSGFTGTYFWVDPEHKIVYIFLSNRTYPSSENIKLIRMNIRTNIQEEIYKLFLSKEKIEEAQK